MDLKIYFVVTFIIGLLSYSLNWISLSNIDPNCSKNILKISNIILFTLSICLIIISFAGLYKQNEYTKFYPNIFLIISVSFIVLSIINLINGKQIKQLPVTTPIKNIEEYTECVGSIESIIILIMGILLGIFSVYFIKN